MRIELVHAPFDPGARLSAFTAGRTEVGAVVSFTGLCRAAPGLEALELEAYPGFTETVILGVAETTVGEHALLDLEVIHRVGRIAPGEPIVWVAAAAAHRRAAFEGCDRMMDFLKSKAPFWKREHFVGGDARWIEPTAQDHADAARWGAASKPSESDTR
ncbi:molybdenum cofactor biosynthesis protein MoaE [soil metagenome]